MNTTRTRLFTFVPALTVVIASLTAARLDAENKPVADVYQGRLITGRIGPPAACRCWMIRCPRLIIA